MSVGNRQAMEFNLWNILLLLSAVAALFFLFTNGVPLIQLGWMHELKSKTRYVNTMIISVSVFFAFLALARWRCASFFDQLWLAKMIKKVLSFPLWLNLSILFVLYVTTFSVVGFVRQIAMETRAFDLGIFAQVVWNTLHGHFLYSSIKEGICILGDHVSPLLAALAPFYQLWPDPRMLLLLQAIAAGSSIFLLASIAREKLNSSFIAIIFALIYCFYIPTRAALHEDFHPEVLAEPFMITAFIFLEKKRLGLFLLSLIAFVSAKESLLGLSFMMGVYAFLFKRWRITGAVIMILSVGILWFDIHYVVPYFSGQPYFYRGFYHHLLAGPVLGRVTAILNADSLSYILKIYGPFLFLPFFSPALILTFPVLFQNVLSINPVTRSFGYHYTTGLTPFVFISAIYGLAALSERFEWISKRKTGIVLIFLLIGILRSGPSEYYRVWQSLKHKTQHTDMIRKQLNKIPSEFCVLTHNNFIPQLVNRKNVYQFNYHDKPSKSDQAQKYNADYVIFDTGFWEPESGNFSESFQQLKALGYRVEFEESGFYILKKEIQKQK